MPRLILSFYDNFGAANDAVKELMDKGFCQDAISLIVHQSVCDRIWAGDRENSWFFSSQPEMFQLPAIGPVLVSGFLASDLRMVENERASLVLALEKSLIPEPDANAYTEGVRRKGILVLVRADRTNSSKALFILDRYCPVDMECLEDQWRKMGWTGFNDTVRPLSNGGLNWPNCITSLPGDALLDDGVLNNWPQNIAGKETDK